MPTSFPLGPCPQSALSSSRALHKHPVLSSPGEGGCTFVCYIHIKFVTFWILGDVCHGTIEAWVWEETQGNRWAFGGRGGGAGPFRHPGCPGPVSLSSRRQRHPPSWPRTEPSSLGHVPRIQREASAIWDGCAHRVWRGGARPLRMAVPKVLLSKRVMGDSSVSPSSFSWEYGRQTRLDPSMN